MTLVIEESEEISIELLSPVLASVKKDNEVCVWQFLFHFVLHCGFADKLYFHCYYFYHFDYYIYDSGSFANCSEIGGAVKTLGITLDDYSEVLASICQEKPGSMEQSDACATSELVVIYSIDLL